MTVTHHAAAPGDDAGAIAPYRTLPPRLPAVLAAASGAFVVVGGLGAGVRASVFVSTREVPREVAVLMGYSQAAGWLLAALGLFASLTALAWLGRSRWWKLCAAAGQVSLAVVAVTRLGDLDDTAMRWAAAARSAGSVGSYHAGLGWGAWLLLIGGILAALACVAGALREFDLRRGIPG